MRPAAEGGGRIGIVLNGSPLFTGGAGSGESDIRKWIIENDWLEAIVALPTDMFYNTGISTYVWILTNHKAPERKGKVQLVNGAEFFQKMRKCLGAKRKELGEATSSGSCSSTATSRQASPARSSTTTTSATGPSPSSGRCGSTSPSSPERLARLDEVRALAKLGRTCRSSRRRWRSWTGEVWKAGERSRRPSRRRWMPPSCPCPAAAKALLQALSERDETAEVCTDSKGKPGAGCRPARHRERAAQGRRSRLLRAGGAAPRPGRMDRPRQDQVGYEIPFNRHFYKYVPPRPLEEIDRDLKTLCREIMELLKEVTDEYGNATKYKPYPAYKESGVEWLGEVPAGWKVSQSRFSEARKDCI